MNVVINNSVPYRSWGYKECSRIP